MKKMRVGGWDFMFSVLKSDMDDARLAQIVTAYLTGYRKGAADGRQSQIEGVRKALGLEDYD